MNGLLFGIHISRYLAMTKHDTNQKGDHGDDEIATSSGCTQHYAADDTDEHRDLGYGMEMVYWLFKLMICQRINSMLGK
jgi:hypothetical protein